MRRTSVLTVLAASALLTTLACGDGDGIPTSPSAQPGSAGTLNVRLTDSPFGSAKAVLVTFSEVAAHASGGAWTRLPFADPGATTRTCDLKKLENSAQDLLGAGALEPGDYTMLRLTVQSATLYFDNSAVSPTPCATAIPAPAGAAFQMTIPSGEVRLNGVFTVTTEAPTTVLLDFDGESSISQIGAQSYRMQPVVRVVSVE